MKASFPCPEAGLTRTWSLSYPASTCKPPEVGCSLPQLGKLLLLTKALLYFTVFYPESAEAAPTPSMVPPDFSHQRQKNQGFCSGPGLPTWSPQPYCPSPPLCLWAQDQEIGFGFGARWACSCKEVSPMPQLEEGGMISRASACPYSRKRPSDRTCLGKGRERGGGGFCL